MSRTLDTHLAALPQMPNDHILTQLDMRRIESGDADLVMEMDCAPQRVNSRGGMQGGLVATLVDVVAGLAALDGLPAGWVPTTTNLAVTYVASIVEGPARATARIVRRGRTTIVIQVEVHDVGADRLAALATVSFMVISLGTTQATDPDPNEDNDSPLDA